jgi:hypothetical protein
MQSMVYNGFVENACQEMHEVARNFVRSGAKLAPNTINLQNEHDAETFFSLVEHYENDVSLSR